MKLIEQFPPTYRGNTITIPLNKQIILNGQQIEGKPAFVFIDENHQYYIFVDSYSGVLDNNIPKDFNPEFRELLFAAINEYCFKTRQGLPNNIFGTNNTKGLNYK